MSRKRIALLYLGLAVTLLITTMLVLNGAGVSRTFVENLIAEVLVRDRFQVGETSVDLGDGVVTLDRFEISHESPESGDSSPLIAVERVQVDVDTNPLGGDVGRVRQIRLEAPHLNLDLASGAFPDLSSILLGSDAADPDSTQGLPAIRIQDGKVTLRFAPDADPVEFREVALTLLPDAEDPDRMVLDGTMTSPAGLATRVFGAGNFSKEQFETRIEIEDFPLDPALASRFSTSVAEILEAAELRGHAKSLVLWVEYDAQQNEDEPVLAGVQLEIDRVQGTPPGVRFPLFGATALIDADTRDDGTVRFKVADHASRGDITASGTIRKCFTSTPEAALDATAQDLLVDGELIAALSQNPNLDRVLRSFTPTAGRLDVHVQLDTAGRDPMDPDASIDLTMKGVNIDWKGLPQPQGVREIRFPEPLLGATGQIHMRGSEVRLVDFAFETLASKVVMNGSVGTTMGESVHLDARCDDLPFTKRTRDAIAAVLPVSIRYYDDFSPRGHTGLSVAMHTVQGVPGTDVRIRLTPMGASASYREFPVRVSDLRGTIEIEPNGVSLDLEGRRSTATSARGDELVQADARLHGRFFKPSARKTEPDLLDTEFWIQIGQTTLDREVSDAVSSLGDEFADTWKLLEPVGAAGFEFTMWRHEDEGDLYYDVRVDADDAGVHIDGLPLPIENIRGPIFVHGREDVSRIDLGIVEGTVSNGSSQKPAQLTIEGSIHTGGEDGLALDLVSLLRGLDLNDRLRDAIDSQGMFSAETWNVLQPSGYVDLIARERQAGRDAELTTELDVTLRDVGSTAAMLPGVATGLEGKILLRDGIATFDKVLGRLEGTEITCTNGRMAHSAGATAFDVTVSCRDFAVDDTLTNLFSGPIQQTFRDRNVRGRLTLNGLNLEFLFPDEQQGAFELDMQGNIEVREASLSLGTRIDHIAGAVQIAPSHIDHTQGFIAGNINNCGFTIGGRHRVLGASMGFRADHTELELGQIRGRIHNGEVFGLGSGQPVRNELLGESDLRYSYAGEGKLSAALGWKDVSLSSALQASGYPRAEYRGNLSGTLRVDELEGDDLIHARGSGDLSIENGSLGAVPMFTAIYSHLDPKQRPRFDSVKLNFDFADRRVSIPEVIAKSPVLTVSGRGGVTMDGYIDMTLDFANLFGTGADWLVLPRIARFLTTGALQFQVYGYLRNPTAAPQWLWQSKPGKAPLGPIPARER